MKAPTTSTDQGFIRRMFEGRIAEEMVFPYPEIPATERENMAMVLDTLAGFAAKKIDPRRFEKEKKVPEEVLDGLREMGAFGLAIPEEYGGVGFSATSYCRFMEDLGRADSSTSVMVGGHQSIGLKALLLFGSDEQKKKWLPELATGERIAAFALTEPEAGSDAASLRMTAHYDATENVYVLNGTKQWITNGRIAGFFTVFAKHDDIPGEDHERISAFIVTSDMPGFSVGPEEDKLGLKASSTTQIHLENVKVPAANLVGQKGKGFRIAVEVLNQGRTSLGAGCVGGCKSMLALAVDFATQRRQFGKSISEFELIRAKLGRMAASTYALESGVYLTTALIDRGLADYSLEGAACKVFGTETLWSVLNDALQIAGGNGFMEEYPYGRTLRDSRINMIFEGTNEILRLYIALTGVKGPGKELASVAADLKNPAKWGGVALRTVRDAIRSEDRFTKLAPELSELGDEISVQVADFGDAVTMLIRKHRKQIVDRQNQLARLADSAMDLYFTVAALSRASAALQKKTDKAADEAAYARLFAQTAKRRIAANLASLEENDDASLEAAAAKAVAGKGYSTPLW